MLDDYVYLLICRASRCLMLSLLAASVVHRLLMCLVFSFFFLFCFFFFFICFFFFFFNDTATTEIYTLSLHDALPIYVRAIGMDDGDIYVAQQDGDFIHVDMELSLEKVEGPLGEDRKSTRLNSSHRCISYAVFCLKKKLGL